MSSRKPLILGLIAGCAALVLYGVRKANGPDGAAPSSTLSQSHPHPPPSLPAQTSSSQLPSGLVIGPSEESIKRSKAFIQLWRQRYEKDISADVLAYAKEADGPPDEQLVKVLGRLEISEAVPLLTEAAKGSISDLRMGSTGRPNHYTLYAKLALARVESRGKTVEGRLTDMATAVDLSLDGLYKLAGGMNDPRARSFVSGMGGTVVIDEVVDLLYTMQKAGTDTSDYASKILMNPAQQAKMQGATLKPDDEIRHLLAYAINLKALTGPDTDLVTKHLVNLGPRAADLIVELLEDMVKNPQKYRDNGWGVRHTGIFRAAAQTGDPRVIPLLQKFAAGVKGEPDKWVRSMAHQSLSHAKSGLSLGDI